MSGRDRRDPLPAGLNEPLLSLTPGEGSSGAETVSGLPGGLAAIGALIIAVVAFLVGRARGRRETEPLELPRARGRG